MANGRIIFLNGASSSGKSSIAKAMQGMLEEPCAHFCIDDYLSMFQKDLWSNRGIILREWRYIIAGFHAAATAIARAGNLVIIDDVLEESPPWIESLLTLFEGLDVIFVGVYCPLEELERREEARGNRKPGQARIQFEQVHAQALYDVEVDTSVLSPDACAAKVVSYMQTEHDTSAFAQLRELYSP